MSSQQQTLRDEILDIVAASTTPICCRDIYKKSTNALDQKSVSSEVNLMLAAELIEVAEKKESGFGLVSFYRLPVSAQQQTKPPGKLLQPTAAKVQQKTSIPLTQTKETTMANKQPLDRSGKLRAFILAVITKQPGITKTAITEYAEVEFPDAGNRISQTLGNLITRKQIKGEGKRGSMAYSATDSAGATAKTLASAQAPTAPAKPKPQKPTKSAPTKPAAAPAAVITKPAAVTFDSEYRFAFGVRKDGGIAICKDGISVVLARSEVQTILAHTTQE